MKILQKYLTLNLVSVTLLALLALVALFSFFSLIDQLADTGRGNYDIPEALLYVMLTTPKLAYELFPIASVIGAMVTLGAMAQFSELVVIRTAGVSRLNLALLMTRSSVILVIMAIIIGELVAPISEETAQQRRSMAMTEQIAMKTREGYWTRDGNSFINIRKVLPGGQVEDIYIYEFDQDDNLRSSVYARAARYENQRWLLRDIEQTSISPDQISIERYEQAEWPSLLDPEMINFVTVQPQFLTFFGLLKYIRFLEQNAQETVPYQQALWSKIIKPFSICAMVLLAILLVRSESRFVMVGQRIFMGSMIGIIFYIGDQISGHIGIVYNIHPAISVTVPTVVLMTTVLYLIRR